MYLGEIIKEYRARTDATMDEFAQKSGLSKGYISMLEKITDHRTGKPIVPSLPTIKKVADAMHERFDTIYDKLNDEMVISLESDSEIVELDKESQEYLSEMFSRPGIALLVAEVGQLTNEEIEELYQISKIIRKRER